MTTTEQRTKRKSNEVLRFFDSESEAWDYMVMRNRAHQRGDKQLVVLVDGPEDNFAVMDLESAIDNGFSYTWEV